MKCGTWSKPENFQTNSGKNHLHWTILNQLNLKSEDWIEDWTAVAGQSSRGATAKATTPFLSPMILLVTTYVAWCLCQVRLRGALNNCGISIDFLFSKLRILWSFMKLRSLFVAFLCLQLGPNEHIAVHRCTLSGLSNHLKETWRKCLGKRVRSIWILCSKTTPWLRDSRCETQFGTRPQELRERKVRPANVDHKMLRVYVISMFHNSFFTYTYLYEYI